MALGYSGFWHSEVAPIGVLLEARQSSAGCKSNLLYGAEALALE